jgi:hypothetical protein
VVLNQGFDLASLPEMRWTPAEATQIFLNNMNSPAKGLEDLVKLTPGNIEV